MNRSRVVPVAPQMGRAPIPRCGSSGAVDDRERRGPPGVRARRAANGQQRSSRQVGLYQSDAVHA